MKVTTYPNLTITETTKGKLPRLPFVKLKNNLLGKAYDLSVVFTDNNTTRRLNRTYRGKNKPANVLSFPLGKKSGEIFLSLKEIKKSGKDFGLIPPKAGRSNICKTNVLGRKGDTLVLFFFIHALLHLKGLSHGSTMERMEKHFSNSIRA